MQILFETLSVAGFGKWYTSGMTKSVFVEAERANDIRNRK